MMTNCGCMFASTIFISCLMRSIIAEDENKELAQLQNNSLDITVLQSKKNEKFLVYRNVIKRECYVEQLTDKISSEKQQSRTLFVRNITITEFNPIYKELDTEIMEFCKNFSFLTLTEQMPFEKDNKKHFRKRREIETNKTFLYKELIRILFISIRSKNKYDGDKGSGIYKMLAESNKLKRIINTRPEVGRAKINQIETSVTNVRHEIHLKNNINPTYPQRNKCINVNQSLR